MRLRYFSTCDENRVKTEPVLQYWDEEYWNGDSYNNGRWFELPYVECKLDEEEDYLSNYIYRP